MPPEELETRRVAAAERSRALWQDPGYRRRTTDAIRAAASTRVARGDHPSPGNVGGSSSSSSSTDGSSRHARQRTRRQAAQQPDDVVGGAQVQQDVTSRGRRPTTRVCLREAAAVVLAAAVEGAPTSPCVSSMPAWWN